MVNPDRAGAANEFRLRSHGAHDLPPQNFPALASGFQRRRIDDRHPEAARRHGVVRRILVLMERYLDARYAVHAAHRLDHLRGWMAIARAMRQEQHDAKSVPPRGVRISPSSLRIQP